ncbi:MAG: Na-translocating system protein MpsC family protein [Planctomycetota bacterium]
MACAVGTFEHGLLGRSPTSVTVIGTGSWMVVHLHEPFSALERRLAREDEAGAERVRQFHRDLFARTAGALLEHVEAATGVRFHGAIAHVDTATGSVIKTLATIPDVDLFVMGRGLPALGVPVNEHRRACGMVEMSGSRTA